MRKKDAIHRGRTLQEVFIEPLHLTANKLAKIIGVPQNRISEISVVDVEYQPIEPCVLNGHLV